jgi:hypothetical protein
MLLLGPSRMTRNNGRVPLKSHAGQWGTKSVTIGMLAAAAVLVCLRFHQAYSLTFYQGAMDDLG